MVRQKIKKTFDIAYLKQIKNTENSCVELQRKILHITVHPFQLKDFEGSLQELLSRRIARYNKQLGGILLGYDNIVLQSNGGVITNDSCYMHINVEADFYIFKPEIGQLLKGVVNKRSRSHIGCLVHQLFNVSLPSSDDDDEGWLGYNLAVGQEVVFRIVEANLNRKLPYIQGEIISVLTDSDSGISTSEEKKFAEEKEKTRSKKKKKLHFKESEAGPSTTINDSTEIPVKKHKKKKSSIDVEENYNEESTMQDSPKKKKKKNHSNESIVEEFVEIKQEDGTTATHKKKRHSEGGDEMSVVEATIETPVLSSKKRKRKNLYSEEMETSVDSSPSKKKIKRENTDDDL